MWSTEMYLFSAKPTCKIKVIQIMYTWTPKYAIMWWFCTLITRRYQVVFWEANRLGFRLAIVVNGDVLSANQTLRSKQLVYCTNTYKVKENAICFDKTQHEGLKRTPFIWIKTKHADFAFFSNVCVFSSCFRALYIAVIFASSVVADGRWWWCWWWWWWWWW